MSTEFHASDAQSFAVRLREIIGDESIRSFAMRCGLSEATMRHLLGKGKPQLDNLLKIAEVSGVSVEWLAGVKGAQRIAREESRDDGFSDTYALVPLYAAEAAMGNGRVNHSEEVRGMVAFERTLLREEGLNPRHLAAIRARGHSMEPLIRDGALLVFDTSRTRPDGEGVYVVRIGDELLAKRLLPLPGGGVEVHSQAPGWPPRRVEAADLPALGIVGRVEIVSQRVK